MIPNTVSQLLTQLKAHPHVVGLILFGSSGTPDTSNAGDYDLFVVLNQTDSGVRSLHFCVNDLPVDLNIVSLIELQQLTPSDSFRWASLREGKVVYDPTGAVAAACEQLRQQADHSDSCTALSEHAIATMRHWHQHMLDKLQNRMNTQPLFCRYILAAHLSQLIRNYFRGPKHPIPWRNPCFLLSS